MNRTMGILTWTVLAPIVVIVMLNLVTWLIAMWEAQQPGYKLAAFAMTFWLASHVLGFVAWMLIAVLASFGVLPGTRFGGPRYWACQSCGYNMRTVPGPICPECGTPHAIPEQKDR